MGKAQKQWGKYHSEAFTKKPPFGIATTRSHNEVASCNRAYLQIKFTTEPKVKHKNIEQISAVLGEA